MKKLLTLALAVALISLLVYCLSVFFWALKVAAQEKSEIIKIMPVTEITPLLSHSQEVWLHALEWCESRGVVTAVNPKDLDNTPSYYSFQFKPGTFKGFGLQYGVLKKEEVDTKEELMEKLKDYELQKAIVTQMILDPKTSWYTQFPGCVKKLGKPPVSKIVTASTSK